MVVLQRRLTETDESQKGGSALCARSGFIQHHLENSQPVAFRDSREKFEINGGIPTSSPLQFTLRLKQMAAQSGK
jgi:hypothetical protein